ncbi:MAG: hypothetical protein K2O18_07715 [Oscillospiraceae bacterium]|nr:hypothetical protein [Oscillospiraceae bacterium]
MIERLFSEETLYGEPVYRQTAAQIEKLRETLKNQMDDREKGMLGQLEALYIRQSSAMLKDAYTDGFSAAVKLLLEAMQR